MPQENVYDDELSDILMWVKTKCIDNAARC